MTVISGKDAYVNGVGCVSSWSAALAANREKYAASCTQGGTNVSNSVKDWTGQVSGAGDYPSTLFPTGNDVAFKGVIDNTSGDALTLDGTILVSQLAITMPVAGGGPITWTADWGAQGALTQTTVGATEANASIPQSGSDVALTIASQSIADVQSITLTFLRPSTTFVNAGYLNRRPGNLEGTISADILNRSLEVAQYDVDAINQVIVTTGTSRNWGLSVKWGAKSGFVVDRSSAAIVGYTINGDWVSVVPDSLEQNLLGWIRAPGGGYLFGDGPE